jgi:hypothetical protein
MFEVWHVMFMHGERRTFNTTFGCENMVSMPFSRKPLEMLLGLTYSMSSKF